MLGFIAAFVFWLILKHSCSKQELVLFCGQWRWLFSDVIQRKLCSSQSVRTCSGGTGGSQEKVSVHLLLRSVPLGALTAFLPTPLLGSPCSIAGEGQGGGQQCVTEDGRYYIYHEGCIWSWSWLLFVKSQISQIFSLPDFFKSSILDATREKEKKVSFPYYFIFQVLGFTSFWTFSCFHLKLINSGARTSFVTLGRKWPWGLVVLEA